MDICIWLIGSVFLLAKIFLFEETWLKKLILNASSSTRKRSRLWIFGGIAVIASASLSGCADFEPLTRSEIPNDAQLSISPSGKQIFLFPKESGKNGKMDGRLITIENGKSTSDRNIKLPENVWHTNWAYEENQILVSSGEAGEFILWKINLNTNEREEIYRSKQPITFLHEFTPGRFIFLEVSEVISGRAYSTWHSFGNGIKTQLSDKLFRGAAHLSKIDSNLFLYPPDRINFFLEGKFPGFPPGVLDRTPWSRDCQKDKMTMCWQTYLDKYNGKFYPGTMEMIGEEGRCKVPGTWIQKDGTSLARDGKTVVFHSIKDLSTKERAIYLVRFANDTCLVNEISLKGEAL